MNAIRSTFVMFALLVSSAPSAATEPMPAGFSIGREIASHGTLATLIPIMAKKEGEELIAKQPDLTDAEKEKLRAIAASQSQAKLADLLDAQAAIYAEEMTLSELQSLAAFLQSDAAKKQSTLQPKLIMGSMAVLGGVDFKKDVMAEFCAQTGKGCESD